MEYWQAGRKVAFYAKRGVDFGFSKVGDVEVWEESSLSGPQYKHTASFIIAGDARRFLAAKYPQAEAR